MQKILLLFIRIITLQLNSNLPTLLFTGEVSTFLFLGFVNLTVKKMLQL